MATALNQNRMQLSRLLAILAFTLMICSAPFFGEAHSYHVAIKIIGVSLTMFCAIGRLYSTAFLGGFKNKKLITDGVYSVMRNPLYFFSLLGCLGLSLYSGHLLLIILMPIAMLWLYLPLIKREEAFLEHTFGQDYRVYKETTPALFPKLAQYQAPDTLPMSPVFLTNALKDSIWWVLALPVIELCDYLRHLGWFPTLFIS